ncbi:inositol hexakisphosphate and diphosphoinositol-pentakisphosphate kinase [Linderina pennispora]|nr:inositol hexakisphosphate and diphosphoinositol-pentakisphosphate kinase [Linderina pennispora]
MDNKARSKPMANILNRLIATGHYEVIFFGDKTILDEDVEKWPLCDFLISFFSRGFPLEKAFQYFRLRKPFSVNSLIRQFLLFDRRIVLEMLHSIGVTTPRHLIASRDGGPDVHPALRRVVEQKMNIQLGTLTGSSDVEEIDEDTLRVGDQIIRKPFVEKPCDAEDHNIYIYYSREQGGGVRRLFRKIGNKSSEFHAGYFPVRRDGSFIYEEFVDVDNSVDVKVYTVGKEYAHAETRKSPVVDGHVRRNNEGKEMRFVTPLSEEEEDIARAVSEAFGQRVCGFDLLRANGQSMVIDVNGWSFVKGNDQYYDDTASILDTRFQEALHHRWVARFVDADNVGKQTYESRWVLKGVFNVCRHADRTPKQKIKYVLRSPPIMQLLGESTSEIMLRTPEALRGALEALQKARALDPGVDAPGDLEHLEDVLQRKIDFPGTKVQVKPQKNKETKHVDCVQFVLKWGGECTHAGIVQSQDLGENMRKDLLLINRHLLDDVKIYSSTERRVLSTVNAYCAAFLNGKPFKDLITVRADMLDDSTEAKDEMERAKAQIRGFFNFDGPLAANPFCTPNMRLPKDMGSHPRVFVRELCSLMCRLIARMERNFQDLGKDGLRELQDEWCCGETPELFRERWKKILSDFQLVNKDGSEMYDPAKVGELYDSLKYDALHNRRFLERIFMSPDKLSAERIAAAHSSALTSVADMLGVDSDEDILEMSSEKGDSLAKLAISRNACDTVSSSPVLRARPLSSGQMSKSYEHSAPPDYPPDLLFTQQDVRALYYKAKLLFDFVTRREYGIEPPQRMAIGVQALVPLLRQLADDLTDVKHGKDARVRFYFTKESHIHTLLNLVFMCDMQTMIPYEKVEELDYLTHIIFEVYERKPDVDAALDREYSLRIGFSPGANCYHVLDMNIDATHALKVLPRRNFTYHIPLDKAIDKLRGLLNEIE